jgi:ATP-dependent Clp protease ATP-binding subunit ClpB
MRIDKLTSKFQMALADAQSLAVGRDKPFIEPAHLLTAMLDQEGGSVRHLLTQAGVNVNLLRSQLGEMLDRIPTVEGGDAGKVDISRDLGRLLNVCDKLAQKRGDQFVSSELFPLAVLEDKGTLTELLREAGASKRTQTPKISVRRWNDSPSISLNGRSRASWIRSSVATRKSGERCRCCNGGPRTTRYLLASPAWARRRSSKAWPSASSTGKCPKG